MLGAIFGDIVGSVYERHGHKAQESFELFHAYAKFTDDTVLTMATADALLHKISFQEAYLKWGRKYPASGYGIRFMDWLSSSNPQPYFSNGNGSAMRVSPIGWYAKSEAECLLLAEESALPTHNHLEGVKGAQAVALAVFMAKKQCSKQEIQEKIASEFGYNLDRTWDEIVPNYSFDITCQGSVPEAICCFLSAISTEDAIRKAVLLNGDTDTQACIAGSIASAFYKDIDVPTRIKIECYLPDEMKTILREFERYL